MSVFQISVIKNPNQSVISGSNSHESRYTYDAVPYRARDMVVMAHFRHDMNNMSDGRHYSLVNYFLQILKFDRFESTVFFKLLNIKSYLHTYPR